MSWLAARLHGKAVFDGVYNRLNDEQGFIAECREGHDFGFDGKTLIHPNQIAAANAIFGPTPEAVDAAYRLVAAANGGAERFEGRMIEAMHRSEERGVGKECVSTWRSRWSADSSKKKEQEN